MLENAANLANATVLVDVFGIVLSFLSRHLIELLKFLGPATVIIVFAVLYALAIDFRDIELIPDIDGGYKCKYPEKPRCLTNPRLRWFLWICGVLRLQEKSKEAKKYYEKMDKEVRKELSQIATRDIWTKLSFDIVPWNSSGDMPSNFYYYERSQSGEEMNYYLIGAIIKKSSYVVMPLETGMFLLQARDGGGVAGSDTKSNIEELKNLVEAVRDSDEVDELVEKVHDANEAWENAKKVFENKLVKIVFRVRFWIKVIALGRIKEQGV